MRPDDIDTMVAVPSPKDDVAPPSSIEISGMTSGTAAPTSGPLPSTAGSMTMSASIVMHSEEASRARTFYRLIVALTLVGSAFMPFVSGPMGWRIFAAICCLSAGMISLYALRALRDEKRYTPRLIMSVGVSCGLLAELALLYFGLFSAATMVLPLGVYFFGLSESRSAAKATYVVGAVGYLVLSVGVVLGLLPDLGPLPIALLGPAWRVFFVVMTQVVFAVTFFFASSSRRATALAIERVNRANQKVNDREALLAEARGELDRALRPGEGRYTGQTIAGFTLGEVVGRGGMGEVYRAENDRKELAAVKLLHPNILGDPQHVTRFMREAELARKVDSPFVTRVLDAGLTPSGLPYVAMELLNGKDLAWHLRETPRMKLAKVAELVDHAGRALVAIRDAGIVHRDLKPHNFVLTEGSSGVWKVLDFGVSRLEASGGTITQGAMIGTPSYMAPEQVRLEPVDHRTDIYALATVAYRAITGKAAFAGQDLAGVLYGVVSVPPPRPSATVRVPKDVELVLAIGMAKAPEDRFQRVEELAEAFRSAVKGQLDDATRARGRSTLDKYPWSKPATQAAV